MDLNRKDRKDRKKGLVSLCSLRSLRFKSIVWCRELEDRLIDFAVAISGVVEALPDTKAGNHIAGQLVRSGTSPAPNYGEARSRGKMR